MTATQTIAAAALLAAACRNETDLEAQGWRLFMSMGGLYAAPPGVATTGNVGAKGWIAAAEGETREAFAARLRTRSDWEPLKRLEPSTCAVLLAVSCVADAATVRQAVVILERGSTPDGRRFAVAYETCWPDHGAGARHQGSYDLTLSEALVEAARRIKREEGYVAARASGPAG